MSHADEDALEMKWGEGGYHGFDRGPDGSWSAISDAGEVLTGRTPAELDWSIRRHWQRRQ
jgi:hypothetical protein